MYFPLNSPWLAGVRRDEHTRKSQLCSSGLCFSGIRSAQAAFYCTICIINIKVKCNLYWNLRHITLSASVIEMQPHICNR